MTFFLCSFLMIKSRSEWSEIRSERIMSYAVFHSGAVFGLAMLTFHP
jgi:hypothetical protein